MQGTTHGDASDKRRRRPSDAEILADFDRLPDGALVSMDIVAALCQRGRSAAWERAKNDPQHPRLIRLSARCTRVRVGDLRAYLRAKQAGVPA